MSPSRLPYLRRDALDEPARSLWDAIVASRGATVEDEGGRLVGPFNAWIHAPEVGARLSALGAVLRFETTIERRLLELAIITVAARWKAEFEWWAHSRMARQAGVSEGVIEAIRRGEAPAFSNDDERIVHAVASNLVTAGSLADTAYTEAQQLLGEAGLVELISLCGYYTLVSYTLNAFTVPLPAGASPVWPT